VSSLYRSILRPDPGIGDNCAERGREVRAAPADHERVTRMYHDGHGADQLPESLDWPAFAGDVDAAVRPAKIKAARALGGRGDRDVGRCGRGLRGERPVVAVAFGQVVRTVEPEVPADWFVVVGGEIDGCSPAELPSCSAAGSPPVR
jgi:hypothetical protein